MALVLDAGPIVAFLDAGDRDHARCRSLLTKSSERLVVSVTVLSEVEYWLRKRGGGDAWSTFVDDLARGSYELDRGHLRDVARARDLTVQYVDLDLGFVDASVIALCERLGEEKVATLDRRHFSVVRPQHCERLALLPT